MNFLRNVTSTGTRTLKQGVKKRQEEELDPRLDPLLDEAGERILKVAKEIRRLSSNGRSEGQVANVARKLEQTADYLKYRTPSNVAEDALEKVAFKHVAVGAGVATGLALCSGALAYHLWKR